MTANQMKDMIMSGFPQSLINKMSSLPQKDLKEVMKKFHQKERELFWELEQEATSPKEKEAFHEILLNIESNGEK